MKIITILGLIAGTLTTISFIPQVIRSWKLKETKDISLWMYIILAAGIFLWAVYGLLIKDLPVTIANIVAFMFVSIVLFYKLKYV